MTINPQNHQLFFCEDCPLARIKNESMTSKCSGHLIRKFIKECGIKCRCHMSCANRVVQREGKGWGVRALQDLPRGTFVCEYAGEILTNTELYERNMHTGGGDGRHTYPVTLDADWGSERTLSDDDALCLDATNWGNVARFINHRCCYCSAKLLLSSSYHLSNSLDFYHSFVYVLTVISNHSILMPASVVVLCTDAMMRT
ncbi:Histone-lysine N-methyltransferase SUVR4 [Linum perenne]